MKVRVKSWNAVAVWKWNVSDDDDVCGICRNAFDGCCPDCKVPGDECPLIWGRCRHVFHLHCLLKWLQQDARQQCPMDRQVWATAS
ncbi:anaphase-promoting complex subunit 11 [Hyaloraphidium curvatum]|nr:anaphase-promoting complex subunit 11 [Hyaloraphidium curvatum]